MTVFSNRTLAITAGVCAALLATGNLLLANTLLMPSGNNSFAHIACGIAVTAATFLLGNKRLLKAAPYLMATLLILLLLCPVFGSSINGSFRYLRVGAFSFTPALLSLPVLSLFWAYIADKTPENISRKSWIILIAATLITAGLIFIEPFVSMAGFVIIFGLIMFTLAGCGIRKVLLAATAVIIIAASTVPLAIKNNPLQMQKNFYTHLFSPDYTTQYHTWSVLTTLKHSVFCGHHQVPATPKYHIPNAVTDSALIAGCGEFGYIFLIGALLSAAVLIACGAVLTRRSKTHAERLLTGGMTTVIALPALFNTLMMTGLLPMGGVAFPFLAYSGTAMLACASALGCILSNGKKNA